MGMPQARVLDPHPCPLMVGAPGPVLPPAATTVLVNCLPAARITDLVAGPPPPGHPIALGSFTVLIQKLLAARLADPCSCGSALAMGSPTVITG
ncbi:MAG: PAAR domain-containing protein [Paracoccaceae bacterium]